MKSALLFALAIFAATSINAAPSAESLMKQAQQQAASKRKNVFLIFSTTGCVWCKVLKTYIESDEIKPIFKQAFSFCATHARERPTPTQVPRFSMTNMARAGACRFMPSSRQTERKSWIQTRMAPAATSATISPRMKSPGYGMVKKAAPNITKAELSVMETKLKSYKRG